MSRVEHFILMLRMNSQSNSIAAHKLDHLLKRDVHIGGPRFCDPGDRDAGKYGL